GLSQFIRGIQSFQGVFSECFAKVIPVLRTESTQGMVTERIGDIKVNAEPKRCFFLRTDGLLTRCRFFAQVYFFFQGHSREQSMCLVGRDAVIPFEAEGL